MQSIGQTLPAAAADIGAYIEQITAACVECRGLFATQRVKNIRNGRMEQADVFCPSHRKPDPQSAPLSRDFEAEWKQICHGHFLDTIPERIPECIRKPFREYRFSNVGMCAVGPTRTYKSRSMHLLMRKMHYAGTRVKIMTGIRLGVAISESWEQGAYSTLLDTLTAIPALFIDDIDKAKMTDRVIEALFAIFDERLAKRLPIFVTTNIRGDEIQKLFPANAGEAFRKRIADSCIPIETKKILQRNGLWDEANNRPVEVLR